MKTTTTKNKKRYKTLAPIIWKQRFEKVLINKTPAMGPTERAQIVCPVCGTKNDYDIMFCTKCANSIGRKFDEGKTEWTLAPWDAIEAIIKIMMFGAKKYAPNNWKSVQPPTRYLDACHRHLAAWQNGEKNDSETGYSHLWHAGCNILFLIWLELKGKLVCPEEK